MKKVLITLLALVALSTAANAQYNNAIGFRLGYGSTAFGSELSYQGFVSDVNRIELDFGVNLTRPIGLSAAAIYQWHWFLAGGFGFYVGPGALAYLSESHFGLGVGGQIGIDYQFNAPIQLSLDVRPMYGLFGSYVGFNYGASLGLRYAF